jgi:hypothetical protein
MTLDPLGEAGGLNLYAFVGNNPVNRVDPWGVFRSHPLLLALVPGQAQFDAAMTALENGNYANTVAYTGQMLTYQLLFVGLLGQTPIVQQGVYSSISGMQTAGTAVTGWWQYIQNNWIRIDSTGTWGRNGSQSGPHCHFDPIPGSRELMRYHLPSQFRSWYGNFWSIIRRRLEK